MSKIEIKESIANAIEEVTLTKEELKSVLRDLDKESIAKNLYINKKDKGILDAVQEKLISRKLLVFGTATTLLMWFNLDPETWGMIAMMYIGGQSAIDMVNVWKWGK